MVKRPIILPVHFVVYEANAFPPKGKEFVAHIFHHDGDLHPVAIFGTTGAETLAKAEAWWNAELAKAARPKRLPKAKAEEVIEEVEEAI